MAAGKSDNARYIWNEDVGVVDTQADAPRTRKKKWGSRKGYWMVFVYRTKAPIRLDALTRLAKQLLKIAKLCKVEIGVLEVRQHCLFLKVLVDTDDKAIDFSECLIAYYKKTLRPEHFVTAIRKPTDFEIDQYINDLRNH